jgi:hypothetical protein
MLMLWYSMCIFSTYYYQKCQSACSKNTNYCNFKTCPHPYVTPFQFQLFWCIVTGLVFSIGPYCPALIYFTSVLSHQKVLGMNFLGLLGECMCIHCSDCSLFSVFTNCTQVSSPVTILSRNSSPSSQ